MYERMYEWMNECMSEWMSRCMHILRSCIYLVQRLATMLETIINWVLLGPVGHCGEY